MTNKAQAILALKPGIEFKFEGENYTALNGWVLPTEKQIQTKIQELQAEYNANQYQRQRAAAYPTWQDQLDKIYHEGIDAWKTEIQAIKDQYPKPDGT